MADLYMSREDTLAAGEPYLKEIIALLNEHIRRHPDPFVLGEVWRVGYVEALVAIVRVFRMMPDQMDEYLRRVCAGVLADTQMAVRQWDTEGPPR